MPTISAMDLTKWKVYLDDNGDRAVDNVFEGLSFIQTNMTNVRTEIETLQRNIELLRKEFAETGTAIDEINAELLEPSVLLAALASTDKQITALKAERRSIQSGWGPMDFWKTLQLNMINNDLATAYNRQGWLTIQLRVAQQAVPQAQKELAERESENRAEKQVLTLLAEMNAVLKDRFSKVTNKISKLHTNLQAQ